MDVIKWQLNFGSCNFGLKSYLWFKITRMISDHIAVHSVQLPLLILVTLKPCEEYAWLSWLRQGFSVLITPYLLNNVVDDLNKTAQLSTCLQQTAGTHPPLKKKIDQNINYLITDSEVVTGKSQTEASMYWPSDSEVNGLRFSRNDQTVEVIKLFIIWHKNKNKAKKPKLAQRKWSLYIR